MTHRWNVRPKLWCSDVWFSIFFFSWTESLFQRPFKGWVAQIKRSGPPPPVSKVHNTKTALSSPLTAILYYPAPVPSANPCIFMSTHQDVFLHHSAPPASAQRVACHQSIRIPLDAYVVSPWHLAAAWDDDLTYMLRAQYDNLGQDVFCVRQQAPNVGRACVHLCDCTSLQNKLSQVCLLAEHMSVCIRVHWMTTSLDKKKRLSHPAVGVTPCDQVSWQETGAYLVPRRAVMRCKEKVTSLKAGARSLGCTEDSILQLKCRLKKNVSCFLQKSLDCE